MKYGIWNIGSYDLAQQSALCAAGYSSLTAAILCSRGFGEPAKANAYLDKTCPLHEPLTMQDMTTAALRVRQALKNGETMAVYGDYDVDGITATCLLTDFLRNQGGNVIPYIPARIEEGYGLNETAITALHKQGVTLIITVDCGITAEAEANLCREMGMDLVITDHHECKDRLPNALAVVNPHRADCSYPHQNLAGCGVAFKLAAAVSGKQDEVLEEYCDLVCLGTVADVMPLTGENRTMVYKGLKKLTRTPRPGIRALMEECSCADSPVTASLIGYTLAPRINAAGRMEEVDVAVELFLTRDMARARNLAGKLCKMNRQRQNVEMEIYEDAVSRLRGQENPDVIVLSGEDWHQGVVGIVSSRLAEEFRCPTFLICMDGDKGKGSSRSYGGFHLFAALEALSPLLQSFGGHELAAGFTIGRENIPQFTEEMAKLCRAFRASDACHTALEVDCEVSPDLLTLPLVDALEELEPCGTACPKPVLMLHRVKVEQLSAVGGGKHLRLRLGKGGKSFGSICFSTTAADLSVSEGDLVDVVFQPQVNEFRGNRSVQLNLVDLRQIDAVRQQEEEAIALYADLCRNGRACPEHAPRREDFVQLWKYLSQNQTESEMVDSWGNLCRKAARQGGKDADYLRTRLCLDVFCEMGLIDLREQKNLLHIVLLPQSHKVDLEESQLLKRWRGTQTGEIS